MPADSGLTVVTIYPELLDTYGDAGNAMVLRRRCADRGVGCRLVAVHPGEPVPRSGDVYLLGGGVDGGQTLAARGLRPDPGLPAAVDAGAVVFAVCAGLQVLGNSFAAGGHEEPGLGLLDIRTELLPERAVGDVVAAPAAFPDLPALVGFENHAGATFLGPKAQPLGIVERGVGNGGGDGTEGVVQGRVVGTYLHGPALALNPALADRLLSWVLGPLAPLDDGDPEEVRRERLRPHHGSPGRRRRGARRLVPLGHR